jgi:HD-GYP domain-containing protein (c-di-GMP phosphodiesterase class II)
LVAGHPYLEFQPLAGSAAQLDAPPQLLRHDLVDDVQPKPRAASGQDGDRGQHRRVRKRATGEHIHRIAQLTVQLARALGVEEELAQLWGRAALLHDVGKVAIPDHILNSPGTLTDEEYAIIRSHTTTIGGEILSHNQHLVLARAIAVLHHERWDGKGYPQGLRGENIPQPASIVTVIDVYDALTNRRAYKDARPKAQALALLQQERGTQFDPQMVDAFLKLIS